MLLSCHSAYCSAAWIGEDVRLAQGTDWRYPTSPEDRIMKNTGTICVRVYVFLLVILKGIFSKEVNDKYVTFLDKVTAWTGSCVVLPCTYTTTDRETIHNFTWYHDAVYNETIKDFVGTVVYNNKDDKAVGSPFANLVQHIGKKDGDCTIMITALQMEHEGSYQLRLRGETKELQFRDTGFKWMSKASLAIKVLNANSSIKISSPKEIKESTPVTLTCSVDYYCPLNNISLSWTGNVSATTTTSSTHGTTGISTTATFSFVPSWQDDKKNLTCTLRRGDELEETETIQLDVKHKPKNVQLLPSNSTITIYKGEKLTLTCEVGSSNPPVNETYWYKDGREIVLNRNLNKIEATAHGKYHCSAKNSEGKVDSNSVQVSVLYAPTKPQIKKLGGDIKEGSPLSLQCSTQANPPVTEYIWYKDDEKCYSSKTNQYNITRIKIQDSGGYKCSARNSVKLTVSDTLNVDVMYPPKKVVVSLTPDGTTFIEGTKVTFYCDVNSSNPKVQRFVWYKDGKIQQTFSNPKSIQAEDTGSYYCQAENRIAASNSPIVQINVLYRPKSAVLEVSGTEIRDGDDVRLECKPGASNPRITSYQWYKDGILQSTTESALRLLKATLTDSGAYTCNASNEIGGTESSPVTIDVQYAPRDVTASISPDRHVSEHTQVKMTCTAKANPKEHTITWYQNNKPHPSSSKYLYLREVQLEDEGEYYCVVSNKVGDERSNTIQLQVSYSNERIIKIVAIAVSVFIILIFLIFLIVRYRARIRKAFSRKEPDDMADSSFFVLKKQSHNDPLDNAGRQTPSASGSTDQLNCSSRTISSSIRVPTIIPRSGTNNETNNDEITTIYSVVKKPGNVPEYENIKSSGATLDESQDDIQYSEIAHLSKEGTRRERCPEVEYAMLKQS